MTLSSFYVEDNEGNLVSSNFLSYNGAYITDPNTQKAINTNIYDASGNLITNANLNSYLIVPSSYSISQSIQFANNLDQFTAVDPTVTSTGGQILENIVNASAEMGLMADAFARGGSQDLQRTYNGLTNAAFVSAFTDAASFHLGVTTSSLGIPLSFSEFGGGTYNLYSYFNNNKLDISGSWFLSTPNTNSIQAGFNFGESLPNSVSMPSNLNTINIQGSNSDNFSSETIKLVNPSQLNITENLTSGTSQLVNLNLNSDGSSVNSATGYSGLNKTGTQQYNQTTNTSSTGAVSATITGTGDNTNLTGATINLASGASATINGDNDSTTVLQGASATINGNGDTTILNTGAAGATITGNNGYVNDGTGVGFSLTGANEQVNIGGYSLLGAATSYANGLNTISLYQAGTLNIANGFEVTFTGSDGTMVANDNFFVKNLLLAV